MLSPDAAPGKVRTPKRGAIEVESRSNWFSYYAGFSSGFVEDILGQLDLGAGATLLDPWLGGGTTAEVALARGLRFKGYDLNPSMLLVAKARTLSKDSGVDLSDLIRHAANAFKRKIKEFAKSPKT
jgi:hypothetical protein